MCHLNETPLYHFKLSLLYYFHSCSFLLFSPSWCIRKTQIWAVVASKGLFLSWYYASLLLSTLASMADESYAYILFNPSAHWVPTAVLLCTHGVRCSNMLQVSLSCPCCCAASQSWHLSDSLVWHLCKNTMTAVFPTGDTQWLCTASLTGFIVWSQRWGQRGVLSMAM